MPIQREAKIGDWYKNLESEQSFTVVAVDADEGTVAIQYFDGAVEEFDMDSWYQLDLDPIPAPEDWSGPYDDLEADDFGDTEVPRHPEDWSGPLDDLEREEE